MTRNKRNIKKSRSFTSTFPILTIIGIGIIFAISLFYEKSWTYNWSGIRGQIKDSVQVAEFRGISGSAVGYSGKKPKQFDRRYWIMKNATESELIKLTEYPNGTIKTIAYEGLMRKNSFEKKSEFLLKAISDTEYSMNFQTGCEGTEMNISEYLIDFVLYLDENRLPPIENRTDFSFTEKERNEILTEYRKVPSLWRK